MHAKVVWGKIRKGSWDQYSKFYAERIAPSTADMKGLSSRLLLRGMEDPDGGIAISFWDSFEEMDAYDKSEVRKANADGARHLYAGEYGLEHFEVDFSSEPEP